MASLPFSPMHSYWYNNGCLFPDMGTVFIAIDKCDQENGCLKVRRTVTCCLLCGLLCGRCLLLPHMRVRVRLFDSMLEISWSYHSNKLTILLCWFRLESCPFQNLRSNLQNTKCFLVWTGTRVPQTSLCEVPIPNQQDVSFHGYDSVPSPMAISLCHSVPLPCAGIEGIPPSREDWPRESGRSSGSWPWESGAGQEGQCTCAQLCGVLTCM